MCRRGRRRSSRLHHSSHRSSGSRSSGSRTASSCCLPDWAMMTRTMRMSIRRKATLSQSGLPRSSTNAPRVTCGIHAAGRVTGAETPRRRVVSPRCPRGYLVLRDLVREEQADRAGVEELQAEVAAADHALRRRVWQAKRREAPQRRA